METRCDALVEVSEPLDLTDAEAIHQLAGVPIPWLLLELRISGPHGSRFVLMRSYQGQLDLWKRTGTHRPPCSTSSSSGERTASRAGCALSPSTCNASPITRRE